MPTLAERLTMYRDALDMAQHHYELADYIDSTARRDRERAELSTRIEALRQKIADAEATVDRMPHNDLFGPINEWNP